MDFFFFFHTIRWRLVLFQMLISEQAQSYNQLAMSYINKPCRQLTMVVVSVMSHSFLMTKIYYTTQLLLLQ